MSLIATHFSLPLPAPTASAQADDGFSSLFVPVGLIFNGCLYLLWFLLAFLWIVFWILAFIGIVVVVLAAVCWVVEWLWDTMQAWGRGRERAAAAERSPSSRSQTKSYFKSSTGTRGGGVASKEEGDSESLWNRSAGALSDAEEGLRDDRTVGGLGSKGAGKK
ncbi:hypothetical protein FA95DRAFT_1558027 [Auriscalpium vulgare]|uniref:Uncharacterized protein n=1 Tax=Auriscalpium vulgare TaxID=40419 RepID=A0ACB8RX46_9AGAM|nr:hypothetical protein FA95DRAFT_1558027 [Auriscalpium vulgare]